MKVATMIKEHFTDPVLVGSKNSLKWTLFCCCFQSRAI